MLERRQQISKIRQNSYVTAARICPYNGSPFTSFPEMLKDLCRIDRICAKELETLYFISLLFKRDDVRENFSIFDFLIFSNFFGWFLMETSFKNPSDSGIWISFR